MTHPLDGRAARPRPHSASMDGPFLEFDLQMELERLHLEGTWAETGRNTRTLVKHPDLRVVLMALRIGQTIPPHRASGRLSLQTLHGRLRVRAAGRTFMLPVGGLLALDRDQEHEVEALADSAVLLTIAWPQGAGAAPGRA